MWLTHVPIVWGAFFSQATLSLTLSLRDDRVLIVCKSEVILEQCWFAFDLSCLEGQWISILGLGCCFYLPLLRFSELATSSFAICLSKLQSGWRPFGPPSKPVLLTLPGCFPCSPMASPRPQNLWLLTHCFWQRNHAFSCTFSGKILAERAVHLN